jgi:Zn finger protein HypA/HybF involved in hydrogenase expression
LYAGIEIGETIYNNEGESLGTVRGIDEDGFYVLAPETAPETSLAEARELTGRDYIMWRCWNCGEMGKIERELPAMCPGCDAPREELYYWAED